MRIDHVAFTVTNMAQAADFFVEVLGFTETGRWTSGEADAKEIRYFSLGSSRVELVLADEQGERTAAEDRAPGFRHLCLRSDDLDIDMVRLAGVGAKFLEGPRFIDLTRYEEDRPVPGYSLKRGLRQALVEGPDGIIVEIMEREE